jgi:hypothetical protein
MQTGTLKKDQSSPPLFAFELTLLAGDFQTEWKRCNMLANYFAAYVAYQFAHKERAENLISTILNELLEAAVRLAPEHSDLFIGCTQTREGLWLDTRHIIRAEAVSSYLAFLEELNGNDNDRRYLDLLTTESQPMEYFNQLGLMMVAHDFGARLSAQPDQNTDHFNTQVFIPTQEFLA